MLEELREIFNYRYLILQLVRRDILTRYKRSFLGVAWTMLNPLGMMLVWTIAFSQFFRAGDLPSYPAYVLNGLLAWTFFSQTTTASMVNLVWGGGLAEPHLHSPHLICHGCHGHGSGKHRAIDVPSDRGHAGHGFKAALVDPLCTYIGVDPGWICLGDWVIDLHPGSLLPRYRRDVPDCAHGVDVPHPGDVSGDHSP